MNYTSETMGKDKTFCNKNYTFAAENSELITLSMFTVIGIMFAGIGLGYLLRRRNLPGIQQGITLLIWLLLFLLGIEVGQNEQVIRSLPTLGLEALTIAVACVLGSCLLAWLLWKWVNRRKEEDR